MQKDARQVAAISEALSLDSSPKAITDLTYSEDSIGKRSVCVVLSPVGGLIFFSCSVEACLLKVQSYSAVLPPRYMLCQQILVIVSVHFLCEGLCTSPGRVDEIGPQVVGAP